MEFFDKIGKKASETYKGAAEKTGKIAKETKLKMAINDNKGKINKLYKEIGKKAYEKHVEGRSINIEEDIKEEITQIDLLADEIEDFRKEILELKDRKQCEGCKKEIDAEAKFCPNCGLKQPERKQEDEDIDDDIDVVESEIIVDSDTKEESEEE